MGNPLLIGVRRDIRQLFHDPSKPDPDLAIAVECFPDPRSAPPEKAGLSQLALAIMWLQVNVMHLVSKVGALELAVAERDRLDDARSDAELDESRRRYDLGIARVREAAAHHTVTVDNAIDAIKV